MAQITNGEFRRLRSAALGWEEETPAPPRRADRLRLGEVPTPVLVAIAVLAVVAVVLGCVLVACEPQTLVVTRDEDGADAVQGDAGEDKAAEGAAEEAEPALRVHVAGAVASPGVYSVPEGSCVWDAVAAAGGFAADADPDALNLAASVSDGMKVTVPVYGETVSAQTSSLVETAATATSSSGLVNVNTATVEELQALSGVGPSTAQAIVDERTKNGPFSSVADLTRVSGIGEKKVEALAGEACV